MREIKFRAWDTERKMFVPQGEIIFSDYGDTSIMVQPNCQEYIGDHCHNGEPQRGRFIISQFIGLKDSKDKEIYEGDIMRIKLPMGGFWGNVTKEKIGVVKYSTNHGSYIVEWEYSRHQHHINLDCGIAFEGEIIGNIYENSELVEKYGI